MSANPLLYEAVWAIEIEPSGRRLLKIGDGLHHWQALPYVDMTYIKGLPEILAELDPSSLGPAVQDLQEALAAERTERLEGDDALRLWTETELQQERAAREDLQILVGQLIEFIREQMGPFDPVQLLTDNGFNVATYNGKIIVTLLDINQMP
jgi:hypothetical protein